MGLEMVSQVRRYQGQCRVLRPLGHQGYRLRSYKKDPPLHSGYKCLQHNHAPQTAKQKKFLGPANFSREDCKCG